MITITLHDPSTICVSGLTVTQGKWIGANIPNTEYVRAGHKRLVPLSRLGQLAEHFGGGIVTDEILAARDAQLQRMVEDYARCGVRIWMQDGELRTDNEILTKHLARLSVRLSAIVSHAEPPRRAKPAKTTRATTNAQNVDSSGSTLDEAYIAGIRNAFESAERDEKRSQRYGKRKRKDGEQLELWG